MGVVGKYPQYRHKAAAMGTAKSYFGLWLLIGGRCETVNHVGGPQDQRNRGH